MKKALCVGINAYPRSPLQGCVNDARDWAAELAHRGYSTALVLDQGASKDGLVAALTALVDGAKWGDRLVFTYSGHGTYVPDRDGDEADQRDEALVCADMRVLTDDEMYLILGGLPRGARLTIISDSCYSGTLQRSLDPEVRFLAPKHLGLEPVRRKRGTSKPRGVNILLSGCAEDEVSYDANLGGRWRGAMTAAALSTLPAASTWRDWHERTLAAITHPQHPQLEVSHKYYKLRAPLS